MSSMVGAYEFRNYLEYFIQKNSSFESVPEHFNIRKGNNGYVIEGKWDTQKRVNGEFEEVGRRTVREECNLNDFDDKDFEVDINQIISTTFNKFQESIVEENGSEKFGEIVLVSTPIKSIGNQFEYSVTPLHMYSKYSEPITDIFEEELLDVFESALQNEIDETLTKDVINSYQIHFSEDGEGEITQIELDVETETPHLFYRNTDSLDDYISKATNTNDLTEEEMRQKDTYKHHYFPDTESEMAKQIESLVKDAIQLQVPDQFEHRVEISSAINNETYKDDPSIVCWVSVNVDDFIEIDAEP